MKKLCLTRPGLLLGCRKLPNFNWDLISTTARLPSLASLGRAFFADLRAILEVQAAARLPAEPKPPLVTSITLDSSAVSDRENLCPLGLHPVRSTRARKLFHC